MAFVKRLRDTSGKVPDIAYSGGAGGVPPIGPLTSVIQTSSSRPGQGPRFREAENIQGLPARQDPPGPGIRGGGGGGRGGSAGSPIAGAIEAVGNRFAKAIRGLPTTTELPTGVPGLTTSDIPANTGFFSPVTDALGFTTPPAFSDFTASLASLKEGGFVRKRT
jgi:hypothetical protein